MIGGNLQIEAPIIPDFWGKRELNITDKETDIKNRDADGRPGYGATLKDAMKLRYDRI